MESPFISYNVSIELMTHIPKTQAKDSRKVYVNWDILVKVFVSLFWLFLSLSVSKSKLHAVTSQGVVIYVI